MEGPKIKQEMLAPKVRKSFETPKDITVLMEKHYETTQAQKQPKTRDAVQYANDKVISNAELSAGAGVYGAQKGIRKLRESVSDKRHGDENQTRSREQTGNHHTPKQETQKHRQYTRNADTPPDRLKGRTTVTWMPEQNRATPYTKIRTVGGSVLSDNETGARFQRRGHGKEADGERAVVSEKRDQHSIRVEGAERHHRGQLRPADMSSGAAPLERGRKLAIRNLADREKDQRTVRRGDRPKTRGMVQNDTPTRMQKPVQRLKKSFQHRQVQKALEKKETGTAKRAVTAVGKGAMVVGRAVVSAAGSLFAMGGSAILVLLLVMVILVGALVASPFGIFFSSENGEEGTVPAVAAIAQIQSELNDKLSALQNQHEYDEITLIGDLPDWADVLAVFAVKVAGSNESDATDVVTLDEDRIDRLSEIYFDMLTIEDATETIDHPDSTPENGVDDSWTEYNLTITLSAKAAGDMVSIYHFGNQQESALLELLQEQVLFKEQRTDLVNMTPEARKVVRDLPDGIDPARERIVRTACSLAGKVNYFWGGKSLTDGWNDRWGTLQKVTASGHRSEGTYRPYGLDCSGFVDWVFYNAYDDHRVIGSGGGTVSQHAGCTDISWGEAQPGDLVFYPDDSHVGIVCGWDDGGEILIIHCAAGANNVVITGKEGFTSVGRL